MTLDSWREALIALVRQAGQFGQAGDVSTRFWQVMAAMQVFQAIVVVAGALALWFLLRLPAALLRARRRGRGALVAATAAFLALTGAGIAGMAVSLDALDRLDQSGAAVQASAANGGEPAVSVAGVQVGAK
jgi:hypothetical protein